MERPHINLNEPNVYKAWQHYVLALNGYCDLLEETITALRDDYSEQVKVTAELRRRLDERDYYNDSPIDDDYGPETAGDK